MVDFTDANGIVNMALSNIGAAPTENYLTEDTTESKQARVWYDYSRRIVLEAFDWNFARKRQTATLHSDTISETSTDPLAGVWSFRYQYPGDALVIRKMQNPNAPPGDAFPFEIETSLDGSEKTIVTDVEDAVIVYTWDQETVSTFSGLFVLALSHLLGHHMAFAITRKRKIKADELQIYRGLLPGAEALSANEAVGKPPRDAEWIRGRQ